MTRKQQAEMRKVLIIRHQSETEGRELWADVAAKRFGVEITYPEQSVIKSIIAKAAQSGWVVKEA